ncbi:hypothetical protein BKA70DRAFT_1555793 [Coprinopsis sp. MPI-PUGE-AT-0042]|nr:hypothetical protein BKA70DRAFT_1555793 [Coprinopsis sp. MPI-PUGE-AT-0042]
MLPQNGQQRQGGPGNGGGIGGTGGFDSPGYFNLDPSQAAKQMAALNAAKQARMGVNTRASPAGPGGTSSGPYLGGINNSNTFPAQNDPARFQMPINNGPQPLLEPSMSNPRIPLPRQQSFLHGLHNFWQGRGQPLPPQLTGIPAPNYDPSTSPWNAIDVSQEPGNFRIAGKDINLMKLWTMVYQNGGGNQLTSNNAWPLLLAQFELPEEAPNPQGNGTNSVAMMVRQHYTAILLPFEDSYKKSLQGKVEQANRQGMNPGMQGRQGMPPQVMPNQMQRGMAGGPQGMGGPSPNGPQAFPTMGQQPQRPQNGIGMTGSEGLIPGSQTPEPNLLDQDPQGIKRKLDLGEIDSKRARPRTGDTQPGSPMSVPTLDRQTSETPSQVAPAASAAPQRPKPQPSRRKIEYYPLAREVETYGGRDLRIIEAEAGHTSRRALRDLHDWGMVDIEHLTMSVRSRLGTELSYALTTFTLLSTMKGQQPGSGFPIYQCLDLLEETLDLVEEMAWGDLDPDSDSFNPPSSVITHHELLNAITDEQTLPFASLVPRQGVKGPEFGPQQRAANYILAVSNIVRNLALVNDNVEFLSRQTRILGVFLRICCVVEKDGVIKPASPALSLNDLIILRKDTLYTLSALIGHSPIGSPDFPTKASVRVANRLFELTASYLVDPSDALPPIQSVQLIGAPPSAEMRPSSLVDLALEVFNRFSQPDANRKLVLKSVSQDWIWTLFTSLVHRLPISDADFHLCQREPWLCHLEKALMALYSLAFLAPPDLKRRMRDDKGLRFKAVAARILQKSLQGMRGGRPIFHICVRRVIESLKVLDDALDPFDNPVDSSAPTLSFGMGFADALESGQEKGTGLLGAYRELTWDMLMINEVQDDNVMFTELDSLLRVEFQ